MFAYCTNNPISFSDPAGYARKCLPICYEFEDENEEENQDTVYPGTISPGVALTIATGPWIWGAQIFITVDSNGYAALQWTPYSGISGGPGSDQFSLSPSLFCMATNAPGYDALNGPGIQVGGTLPPYSLDYVGILDEDAEDILYHGLLIGGFGTSPDVHITGGKTMTIFAVEFDWNLFHQVTSY